MNAAKISIWIDNFSSWANGIHFTQSHLKGQVLSLGVFIISIYLLSALRRAYWRKNNFPAPYLVKFLSHWPTWWYEALFLLCLILGVGAIALASLEPIAKKQISVPVKELAFIAFGVDRSLSMLADIEPEANKSRLEVAKKHISALVMTLNRNGSGDQILLFTFADKPTKESRDFTSDYDRSFLLPLSYIDDVYVRTFGFGTDLAAALEFCGKVFPKNDYKKFCLVFTDGELEGADLAGLNKDFQEGLAKWRSQSRNIHLYFIAAGSDKKAEKIPKFDFFGNQTGEYETGEDGRPIETRANPGLLRKAATEARAGFIQLDSAEKEDSILNSLIDKDRKIIGTKTLEKIDYVSDYFLEAYLALWFLMLILM